MATQINSIKTFLSFVIDKEYFAVSVDKVLEVLQMQKINRIPNVTSDIKGVTNFRGDIIPVFDTRMLFHLPERNENEKYVIIVVEVTVGNNKSVLGAIVDKVKDVILINDNELLPVPKMGLSQKEEFISNIFRLNNDFVMLLNIDKMFQDKEILTTIEF